ncbi:MAG: radical SAM family heme chaperone HemW [Carboxydocellales bacterium]
MALSLYIHIPFCLRKCNYCDFVSYAYDADLVEQYLVNLYREMELVSDGLSGEERRLSTIFLGGGTPTSLSGQQLHNILQKTREYFIWDAGAEVTVEANPGTLDGEKLNLLRAGGVNRLSLGVQAFQPQLLQGIGRIHNTRAIYQGVELAREAGFTNLNLDLMYGLPGQSMVDWLETLEKALELGVEHISAYSLKLEPETPFYRQWQQGRLKPCDEDLEADMYQAAIDRLTAGGLGHYEISNFARPGLECRHNLTYWLLDEYLGLGPAAHSLIAGHRLANCTNLQAYLNTLANGQRPLADQQFITSKDEMAEFMFLGLRLIKGVQKADFTKRFGISLTQVYGPAIARLITLNLLEETSELLRLTSLGLALGNEVFEAFL